jgi:hypothetical protein
MTSDSCQAQPGDSGHRILAYVLLVATSLIYLRALPGAFVWDDRTYFLDNDILPTLQPWQFTRIFSAPTNYWGEFLPIRDYLYVVEYQLFGTSTPGYHLVSLLLYLAIGLALYRLLLVLYNWQHTEQRDPSRKITASHSGPALAVTALFLLHPCHVESVAYISGQKDLLSTLFTFLTLRYLFESYSQRRLYSRTTALGILCYYCAILSKLTAISTFACVPLLWVWARRVEPMHLLRASLFWIVASLPVVVWTLYSLGIAESNADLVTPLPIVERILLSLRLLGAHTLQALLPVPLNFGYPIDTAFAWDAKFTVGISVLAAVALALVWRLRSMATLGLCTIATFVYPCSESRLRSKESRFSLRKADPASSVRCSAWQRPYA